MFSIRSDRHLMAVDCQASVMCAVCFPAFYENHSIIFHALFYYFCNGLINLAFSFLGKMFTSQDVRVGKGERDGVAVKGVPGPLLNYGCVGRRGWAEGRAEGWGWSEPRAALPSHPPPPRFKCN